MSTLGDRLVKLGKVEPYDVLPDWWPPRAAELNALRDELIELRAKVAPDPEPCSAETRSWDHFRPEQIDSYWIRCSLAGPHNVHEDSHTGLHWRSEGPGQ